MSNLTKHAFGSKANLDAAISGGKVDNYDEVFLTDTQEAGFLDGEGNFKYVTPRTQQAYTIKGTNFGALGDGDVIPAGKSLDEIMAMATQKAISPTYIAPKLVIVNNSGTVSGNYEAGTTISPKLKATFTQNDAGALTGISVLKGDAEVGTATESPYAFVGDDFVIGDESVAFNATASYEAGAVKQNNLGQDDATGKIEAGTVNATSKYTFNGYRNAFYGAGTGDTPEITSDVVRSLSNKKLNISAGTVSMVVAAGSKYVVFACPGAKTLSKVKYVEANDPNMLGSFDQSVVKIADARGGDNGLKDYNVYVYTMAVASAADMTFEFTVA